MIYNYYFDIAAIILTAMLLLNITFRSNYPTKSFRCYRCLLWLNLISSIFDLISAFTISFPDSVPIWVNHLVNIGYLSSINLMAVCSLLYVIILVRGSFGTKIERILWKSIAAFDIAVIGTSPLTKLIFFFNDKLEYCHGTLFNVLYVLDFAMLFYMVYLFLHHRKILTPFQRSVNITFIMLLMASVALQAVSSTLLIESFCAAVAFMMLNVALDNPALYFYRGTFCYNQNAFNQRLADAIRLKQEVCIVAFNFADIEVFRSKFRDEMFDRLVLKTMDECHALFGKKKVYYLENHLYAIEVPKGSEEAAIRSLQVAVGKNVDTGDRTISLIPHFCVLHSDPSGTVSETNEAIIAMLGSVYRKTGDEIIYDSSKALEENRREAQIVHLLRNAIQEDGFEMYYQPIFERKSGRYISAEALIRLKDTESLGFVGPGEFIPIAEKNGMILNIGDIIFEKVCRFFRDSGLQNLGISYLEVNLSILQLLDHTTPRHLMEYCNRYHVSPSSLNLEITETASADQEEKNTMQEIIRKLREYGFTFSLDDYGSGYSTATYLAEMPFRIVKIDKSILWNAKSGSGFQTILENTTRLVHAFEKQCLTEGVENAEMVELLESLGMDYMQGYYFSKPLPADDFVAFLKEKNK